MSDEKLRCQACGQTLHQSDTPLARLRQRQGVSQHRAHEVSGLCTSAISRAESGRGTPNVATMKKLAKGYGVSLLEVMQAVAEMEGDE